MKAVVRRRSTVCSLSSVVLLLAVGACGEAPSTMAGDDASSLDRADAGTKGPSGPAGPSTGAASPCGGGSLADVNLVVDEEQEASFVLSPSCVRRFDVDDLPPGARFDGAHGKFTFVPDFTQSGTYSTRVLVHRKDDGAPVSLRINVTVRDSIAPPSPTIVSETAGAGFRRIVVRQVTDAFLDASGRAGRTYDAVVVVPAFATDKVRAPVVIGLHGFGAGPNNGASSKTTFRIEPHDPDNTYWWGYADGLPGKPANQGNVNPYTLRRVLHLLDWVLTTFPSADPDRVFSTGDSMGGAGALVLGFHHARHFAGIEATIAQTVARNHRPSRINQLAGWWGTPQSNASGVWDTLDVTRMLRDSAEARDQWVFTKHGKDDGTIHFGAVVTPSPLTKKSFFGAVEDYRVGHLAVWDEGGHGPADPVLGPGWWDSGWSRITDNVSFLKRTLPFPAFTRSSANDEPIGASPGNGKRAFNAETGYAAALETAGDTGWSGDIAGAMNRFLRWENSGIVDTHASLALPLRAVTTSGDPAPKAGYPTKRDRYDGPVPIVADVTPRRAVAFRPAPGEKVAYRFGALRGTVVADADGTVTVPSLPITGTVTKLELERETR